MGHLAWNRAAKGESGQTVYTSKCGRYTIEKKQFVAPSRSTGYVLRWRTKDGVDKQEEAEGLNEAKSYALMLSQKR
jgi:hypothetical protein